MVFKRFQFDGINMFSIQSFQNQCFLKCGWTIVFLTNGLKALYTVFFWREEGTENRSLVTCIMSARRWKVTKLKHKGNQYFHSLHWWCLVSFRVWDNAFTYQCLLGKKICTIISPFMILILKQATMTSISSGYDIVKHIHGTKVFEPVKRTYLYL